MKRIAKVDLATGEIVEGTPRRRFSLLYDVAVDEICDLKPLENRVVLKLIRHSDWEMVCRRTAQELADELKNSRPEVSRALKAVVDRGLVEKKGPGVYRVLPHVARRRA